MSKQLGVFSLTPKQIVAELNKYIVGQDDAKKAVAIALRNRYRRKLVASPMREEIVPKKLSQKCLLNGLHWFLEEK